MSPFAQFARWTQTVVPPEPPRRREYLKRKRSTIPAVFRPRFAELRIDSDEIFV